MFTEAITQRQGGKSRAAINKTTRSRKQLLFDVQFHMSQQACMVSDRLFQFSQTQTALQSFLFLTTQLLSLAYTCTNTILSLTSTKELQVADLFSDLQLEDLLEDLLPQRLLDDSHPLQLLAIQPQQRPSCQEGDYMWMNFLSVFFL